MKKSVDVFPYFPCNVPISRAMWERLRLGRVPDDGRVPEIVFIRQVAGSLNRLPQRSGRPVKAGLLNLYGLQVRIFRCLVDKYDAEQPGALAAAAERGGWSFGARETIARLVRFADLFPGAGILAGAETPVGFVA